MRWTLDRAEDFEFIKKVLESIYPSKPDFYIDDVVEFLRLNPAVEDLNKHIVSNEGYYKSLREDRIIK